MPGLILVPLDGSSLAARALPYATARVASGVHADVLVVVSEHVFGGASAMLGSFAQGILRRSPCPVLVVRPDVESRCLPDVAADAAAPMVR